MRILYSSVGHWVKSGYGRVSYHIIKGLIEKGYEVIEISNQLTYGWLHNSEKHVTVSRLYDAFAQDVVEHYYKLFKADLLLTLVDVWVYTKLPEIVKKNNITWIPHVPVDAKLDETCEPLLNPLKQARRIIAFSKFGERELKRFFNNIVYIPHGVDTKLFKPANKTEARKRVGFPVDAFIFGHVAANYSTRKDFPHLYRAFRIFLDMLPKNEQEKTYLYHHTSLAGALGLSFDILRLARKFGILRNFIYPTIDIKIRPTSENELVSIYNSLDVYVTASRGEGFGLPVIEAQACGVPVIAPANTSHVELVQGHGWLVSKFSGWDIPLHTPIQQIYPIVDEEALADMMYRAYTRSNERKRFGRESRLFAMRYDWNIIINKYDELLRGLSNE